MPRRTRKVLANFPHHVIHRGHRKQIIFFNDRDKELYLQILSTYCELYPTKIWAYCLMDNHVHLIAVPLDEKNLSLTIGETEKAYSKMINQRFGWKGTLWDGRYKSVLMDESHVWTAVRYVERNPVRAGIVEKAEDYRWSSAGQHILGRTKNSLLSDFFLQDEVTDWSAYLGEEENLKILEKIRKRTNSGRPIEKGEF